MKNMGSLDRIIRALAGAGLVIAAVALALAGSARWWLAIPGVALLLTSGLAFCPLYLPFGISTAKKKA